jgi:hypothetical protein
MLFGALHTTTKLEDPSFLVAGFERKARPRVRYKESIFDALYAAAYSLCPKFRRARRRSTHGLRHSRL